MLIRLFPALAWLGELKRFRVLRADILAGITVALVLIPQSMAYAQLAGLPPYYGLYAALIPPTVAALFGSSRQLATGPVAVVSLMSAAALAPLASEGGDVFIAYAVLLGFLVGAVQFVLGVLRLGVLVNFLSHPVVMGFTNAAAIIIATSQLGKLLGVSVDRAGLHYETVWNTLVAAVHEAYMPTLAMAGLALLIMLGLKRYLPKLPNVLFAVGLTTVLAWYLGYEQKVIIHSRYITNPELRLLLAEYQQLNERKSTLDKQLQQAESDYQSTIAQFGADHTQAITALHIKDLIIEQLKFQQREHLTIARELRSLHFIQSTAKGEAQFILRDQAERADAREKPTWRIYQLNDDGTLLFRTGGAVVGAVPQGLPVMKIPAFNWEVMLQLLASAIIIALIGFMEAIAIAKSMATRTRQHLDVNQELIGQGTANMVGSFFQSYAVAGSFSRSAVNLGAGAITGFSSVVTSLVVVITLLWLTPLLYHLPQATLAAVIMLAVISLIRIEPIIRAWKAHKHDGIVAVITFVLTLLLAPHLELGILIGLGLSLGLYLYRTMQPRIAILSKHQDGTFRDARVYKLATCDEIGVIRIDGSLYFANSSYVEDKIREKVARKPRLKFLIIDAEGINQIDATAEEVICNSFNQLQEMGIELYFARMKRQALQTLQATGSYQQLGEQRFFNRIQQAVEHAWSQLEPGHAKTCPLNIS